MSGVATYAGSSDQCPQGSTWYPNGRSSACWWDETPGQGVLITQAEQTQVDMQNATAAAESMRKSDMLRLGAVVAVGIIGAIILSRTARNENPVAGLFGTRRRRSKSAAPKTQARCIYCDGAVRAGQGVALNRFPGDTSYAHVKCLREAERY